MSHAAPDLKRLLIGAQLPALPQSAIRLLELSQDSENGPAEFAVPIEADPGLTGQVLRFVNSSYFGFSREISNVRLAITLVGIRTIKNFALWSAVFSLMPNPKCGLLDVKSLWQDSLRRALFARELGKMRGMASAEDLFAAALLQDMAIPLLAKELPKEYEQLLEDRDDGKVRLSELEQDRFGWSHAEAGTVVARHWRLPDQFAALIQSHTGSVERSNRAGNDWDGPIVALSSLLPGGSDDSWHDRERMIAGYKAFSPAEGPELASLFVEIDRKFDEFAPVLKLTGPTRSLVQRLDQESAVGV